MLRHLKFITMCCAVAIVLASGQSVDANGGGSAGVYTVIGTGDSPQDSRANAYALLNVKIDEIRASLPEGQTIISVNIVNEGWNGPFEYFIDFTVDVGSNLPPSPPGEGQLNFDR